MPGQGPGQATWARLVRRARPLSVAQAVRTGPWLVLAPHPDDESLGAGGLLALLASARARPHVAILTDGSASHVGAPGWGPARLGHARAIEADHALRMLGAAPALRLGWPDARPPSLGDPAFEAAVRRLAAHVRRHRIRALAVCWVGEAHCDHAAAAALARAVAAASHGRVRRFDYMVWGWTDPDLARRTAGRRAVSVDVARHRAAHLRAVLCHRSQTGTRITGARDAFRLPRTMVALARRPRTLLLTEDGHAT